MFIVTGAAGFIGSAMVWMLNGHGIDNIILVDTLGNDPAKWKNLRGLHFQDIWKPSDLLPRLAAYSAGEISAIIHMGACSSTTETDGDFLLENNYQFSRHLGEWAMATNTRFIYASSASVYGDGGLGFSDDPALLPRLRPLNMYGYSKQLFDLHAIRNGWHQKMVGLRFFNIFGPNEYHKGSMASMVYKAVEQVKSTGEVRLFNSTDPAYPDGGQVRDFFYVKDAVNLVWEFLERPTLAGIFNVGSGQASSWNELMAAVFAALDQPERIRYFDMPPDVATHYQNYTCADMSSLKQALPAAAFARPLHESVADYLRNYLAGAAPRHLDYQDHQISIPNNTNRRDENDA